MLVVDLLHEFELGVWKTLFTHLIRILYAALPGDSLVIELDKRCVNVKLFYVLYPLTDVCFEFYQLSRNLNIWARNNTKFFI